MLIATESPTETFWIDDVQLVEGPEAMPIVRAGSDGKAILQVSFPAGLPTRHRGVVLTREWNTSEFPRDKYIFAHRRLCCDGFLHLPRGICQGTLQFRLDDAEGKTLFEKSRHLELPAGTYRLDIECPLNETRHKEVVVHVGLEGKAVDSEKGLERERDGDRVSNTVNLRRRLITETNVESVLAQVELLRERLRQHVQKLREHETDPAYPLVTLTILDNFIAYVRQDIEHDEIARAYDAAMQMRSIAKRALQRKYLPPTPRYITPQSGRSFRLEGPSQLGMVRWPDGRVESSRPLQFVGMGHFAQVKKDIEKFVDYGCNIIQFEIGPRSVLPSEERISTTEIDRCLGLFDRAAKAGVAVNLLISPHYFPQWAYEKWPHLHDAGGGFLQVDVQAPEARQVYETYLRVLIPRIKDHPALHSICLSNEPVFVSGEKSPHVRRKWHQWLRGLYGDIEKLNRCWQSGYADFESIPAAKAEKIEFTPLFADYLLFNREAFAEFHAWMAVIIREMAPRVPLHAKIMIAANFGRHVHGPWSISPELFARLSDINGNDCWKYYQGTGSWANDWQGENMGYDFQRSMADKPVFNSENHLITDRNIEPVPPEHIANVVWQGAIHGQSATTTWVWERTFSYSADTTGSIMHRPACVEAMGHTGLDLMRLAEEVAAFQKIPIEAAILWSPVSVLPDEEHPSRTKQVYEALNFMGIRIGFITDCQLRQSLEGGFLPETLTGVKLIVATGANHVPDSTVAALEQFSKKGGRVLCVGRCFSRDEYGCERKAALQQETFRRVEMPLQTRELFDFLSRETADLSFTHPLRVQTLEGKAAWGVEYLALQHKGRLLANLVNYRNETQKIEVKINGHSAKGIDLLSGQCLGPVIKLPPLRPVLLEIEASP